MRLNKNQAYLLVIGLSILLVLIDKSYFLLRSGFTKGEVIEKYIRHTSGRYGGKSTYPIVKFTVDNYEVTFPGGENLSCKIGDKVDVVYLRSHIEKAKIFSFSGFWLPGFIYGLIPFILLSGIVYSFMDPKDTIVINFDKSFSIRKLKDGIQI